MTKDRKISIIGHSVFLAIVVGLLIFLCFKNSDGIYYDLAIDHALGNATSWFGRLFMVVGEYPQYILIPIGGTILFYNADTLKDRRASIALRCFAIFAIAFGFYIWVTRSTKVDNMQLPAANAFAIFAILFYGSIFLGVGALVPKDVMHRLFKFGVFLLVLCLSAYVIMTLMKTLWCRMRYRDMLKEENYDGFTPWFKLMFNREVKVEGYDYTSFPSGHTSSAAHIFVSCLLPNFFKKLDKKWIRYSLYGFSITFTVVVAISRLVNTAHFLSDVIVGGSVTYGIFYLLKYLFFRNGYEFKQKEIVQNEVVKE